MNRCSRSKLASDLSKSIICELSIDILHRILELMPIKYAARTSTLSKLWRHFWSTKPHLVFDHLFFQYVSNIGASAASIIHKILMQHTGNILEIHFISKEDELSQSDMEQCIIFVSNHGIQKLTLDMCNDEKYVLPDCIFTCATLTHLKLSRCIFKLPDGTHFPNLVSLQLEHSELSKGSTCLILSMLETLELKFCIGVDHVNIISPKIENLTILSSYTVTFQCFNVNRIFKRIKHLCLDGSSLKNLGSVYRLDMVLNLQSLKFYDLKIDVKRISYALCLLRNSPKLYEIDIDEVVKVDDTVRHTTELFDYLSKREDKVSEALNMIRTVRLRKFKGTSTEMCLIKVILAHSPKLVWMVIEQIEESSELLKELISYHRASPNAETSTLRLIEVRITTYWSSELIS